LNISAVFLAGTALGFCYLQHKFVLAHVADNDSTEIDDGVFIFEIRFMYDSEEEYVRRVIG
jgi:hypothetical protein